MGYLHLKATETVCARRKNRLLLIVSSEVGATCDIMAWLDVFGIEFIRINDLDKLLDQVRISIATETETIIYLAVGNNRINMNEISGSFVRHGFIKYKSTYSSNRFNDHHVIKKNMEIESNSLIDYIQNSLQNKPYIGRVRNQDVNKLQCLTLAKQVGLEIPDTLVTDNLRELISFRNKVGPVISKSLQNVVALVHDDLPHLNYTSEISQDDLEIIPKLFYPSLFQNKIDKEFELRIFYLDGEFYSMAILSQNDPQTSVDFRNYNLIKPNRNVPYQLPHDISMRIDSLMKKLGQQTGSIDMIVTADGKYIFLEINPVGQFGMVSYPCNYNLSKRMAEYLNTMIN